MRVLAIGTHPDDLEIACAGTLLKCIERGDEVYAVFLCSGDLGHEVIPPNELKVIRDGEIRKAGKMGGYKEVIYGGFDDLSIYDNKEARDKVTEIIRRVDPDFIITEDPNDYMPDHTATNKLVFDASFAATVPHYPSKYKKPARLVPIYYMDTPVGVHFDPEIYVDITDQLEKKIEMIKCHESQLVWLMDHDHIDFTERVRVEAKYRGYQCGVKYAEAFRQCNCYLKLTTKRLLP